MYVYLTYVHIECCISNCLYIYIYIYIEHPEGVCEHPGEEEGVKGPSVVFVVRCPSVCPVVRPVDVVRPLSVHVRPSSSSVYFRETDIAEITELLQSSLAMINVFTARASMFQPNCFNQAAL